MFFQFSSVTQSCPTLCDPTDYSTPGFPVHHQLLKLAQTHVHRASDAIRPSHPLSPPSPPPFNLSQHQGLFQWVGSSHQVTKYWSIGHVLYLHAMLNLHFICMSVYELYSFPLTCLYSFHTTLIKSLTVNLYRISTSPPPPSITYFFTIVLTILDPLLFCPYTCKNQLVKLHEKTSRDLIEIVLTT